MPKYYTPEYDDGYYRQASFSEILDKAKDFLLVFQCDTSSASGTPVKFQKGLSEFHFSSRGMKGIVVQEVADVEALLLEGWRRMAVNEDDRNLGVFIFERLEREIESFLDLLPERRIYRYEDMRQFAEVTVKTYFPQPSPSF